jgi:ABC-2 type transport system ATP-binding protein
MVEINDLSFGYTKRDLLFKGLNLNLNKGGLCGLLGKNGSGKTTLLKIISGLIFPGSGHCQVMGKLPEHRDPSFLSDIYLLPEDLYVSALTADHYVEFYAIFYPRFDQALFNSCMNEFDIPRKKLLTTLSHGQKKKFLISFGLASQCRLFILDEPTNGLDIPSKGQFRKLLAANITDDKLFIISTHQVHDVENLIDSVVILDEGKIIYHEPLIEQDARIDLEDLFTRVLSNKMIT